MGLNVERALNLNTGDYKIDKILAHKGLYKFEPRFGAVDKDNKPDFLKIRNNLK